MGVVMWPGGEDAAVGDDDDRPTTLDLPTSIGTLPPPTTLAPSTTLAAPTAVPRDIPFETSATLPPVGEVALPDEVAALDTPTDVVALTAAGQLVTIELPSGATTAVDLDVDVAPFSFDPELMTVSPDATMVATSGGELVVVSRDGATQTSLAQDQFVDADDQFSPTQIVPFGWERQPDGSTSFVVIAFDDATGRQREWLVDADGDLRKAPAQRAEVVSSPLFSYGARFVNDAGGAYRVDADGSTTLISTGRVLALSGDRVLLRECDAARQCASVLRDHGGGEVGTPLLDSTVQITAFGGSLSPDGRAMSYSANGFGGPRTIADLETGDSVRFANESAPSFGDSWAADSTGVFSFGNGEGLRFLPVTGGQPIIFATEAGIVRAVGVRPLG